MMKLKPIIFRLVIALVLIGGILPVFTPGADAAVVVDHTRTDLTHISLTITDNGAAGLSFGTHIPGPDKWPEATSPSITITNNGTGNIKVFLKGTNFTNGAGGTINIGNVLYNDSNNSSTALAMSTSYNATAWKTLAHGANVTIYHWLTIPAGTPPGTYSSNFTYETQ